MFLLCWRSYDNHSFQFAQDWVVSWDGGFSVLKLDSLTQTGAVDQATMDQGLLDK